MKHELIEKIVKIFNEGQGKYTLSNEQWSLRLWEDGFPLTTFESIGDERAFDAMVHGFLINREYGFAEAWADKEMKKKPNRFEWKSLLVETFVTELAFAVDKDTWLEENL